jgi:hypothetical protein
MLQHSLFIPLKQSVSIYCSEGAVQFDKYAEITTLLTLLSTVVGGKILLCPPPLQNLGDFTKYII